MAYGTINADLMTTSDGVSSSGLYGFKNRLINGTMVIDQRNAGASTTPASGAYTLDRWQYGASQASKVTIQQNAGSVTPPAGYTNYLGVTVGASANVTIGAGDYFSINQKIEGYNAADLNWGATNAKTITLSFWVRSSLTGTFGGSLLNSAGNRSYPFSYSIPSANTWTSISITIAGDTSGTWLTTNGLGILVNFGLGYGSTYGGGTAGAWVSGDVESVTGAVSVVSTNSATFYITGVQLEKGSTATSFDYRPYGQELMLCQRYLPAYTGGVEMLGYWDNTNEAKIVAPFLVEARVAPTGVTSSGSFNVHAPGVGNPATTAISFSRSTTTSCRMACSVASGGLTSALAAALNSSAGKILFTGCEL